MVDVTNIPDVKACDEVDLIGDYFMANDMGKLIRATGYNVVSNISLKVSKMYYDKRGLK